MAPVLCTVYLALAATAAAMIENKKKAKKRKWVKELKRKEKKRKELNIDIMDEDTYLELLKLVTPLIKKEDTHLRKSVTPHERLTATLRFLATGCTYEDLKFTIVISPQLSGEIIPETWNAIYTVLKDKYLKVRSLDQESIENGLIELGDRPLPNTLTIETFLSICATCNNKKGVNRKLVIKPIVSKDFNERGQIDLVDFQSLPDGKYKWILNYQDHHTKFISLLPLESKRAVEVASNLLTIFLTFSAPKILQSDNGREFVNSIINEIKELWPECIIVHGRPRHPQSQGSIERSNQDVENMLRAWMKDNDTKKWSIGLKFVQF
ncbi:hypothetical protein QTP88_011901 [Uroleucon formosanum]